DATSPGIADDGSFVCFRHAVNGDLGFVLRYPRAQIIEYSIHAEGGYRDAGEHPSMSSDGRIIWWYSFVNAFTGDGVRRLQISGIGQVEGPNWEGDFPDVNAAGQYVFAQGGQIFHSARGAVASGG